MNYPIIAREASLLHELAGAMFWYIFVSMGELSDNCERSEPVTRVGWRNVLVYIHIYIYIYIYIHIYII